MKRSGQIAPRGSFRRRTIVGLLAVIAIAVAACSSASKPTPAPPGSISLYGEPYVAALDQAAMWTRQGRTDDAGQLAKITSRPVATWLKADPAAAQEQASAITKAASAAGKLPVLVAYNLPGRDCGSFSSGGAAGPAEYQQWWRNVAAGLGERPAWIIMEPDAVPGSIDRCSADAKARQQALADAIQLLKKNTTARVYLDAGNPQWISDLPKLAEALKASGVGMADGFSLNVSNFATTADNIAYGRRLSALLGNAHFVIDTSRNGRGPASDNSWCNPQGRALGNPPTTSTGQPLVDALLWVKRPGESDGDCGRGEPRPGTWWPDGALQLAQNSPSLSLAGVRK